MPWWGWVIVAVVAYAILAPIKIHLRRKRKAEKGKGTAKEIQGRGHE